MKNTPNHKTKSMNIVLDVLMIDHPTDISKDCHQTSQIFAQVAVVLTRCLELDGTCMTSTSSIVYRDRMGAIFAARGLRADNAELT